MTIEESIKWLRERAQIHRNMGDETDAAQYDGAADHIVRLEGEVQTAVEELNRNAVTIPQLHAEVESLQLARIAYENPGIDIEEVKRYRASRITDHAWVGIKDHPDDDECSECGEPEHRHKESTR